MQQGQFPSDQTSQPLSSAPPASKPSEKVLPPIPPETLARTLPSPATEPIPFMTGGALAPYTFRMTNQPESLGGMATIAAPLMSPHGHPSAGATGSHEWIDPSYAGAATQPFWPPDYSTHPTYAYTPFAAAPPPAATRLPDAADSGFLQQYPFHSAPSSAMPPVKSDSYFGDHNMAAADLQSGVPYVPHPSAHIGVHTTMEQSLEATIAYPSSAPPTGPAPYLPPPHHIYPPPISPQMSTHHPAWSQGYLAYGSEPASQAPSPVPVQTFSEIKKPYSQSEGKRSKSRKLSALSSPTKPKAPRTAERPVPSSAPPAAQQAEGSSMASFSSGSESLPPDQIYPHLPMDKICIRLKEILEVDQQFQNVTEMAHRLQTRRKRLYEAVNVLTEIGFVEKKGYDNYYTYNGVQCLPAVADIKEYVEDCQRSIDADVRSTLRFQVFFILVQIHNGPCTVLELTERLQEQITRPQNPSKASTQTLRRRLYDLVRVLEVFGVVSKQETWTSRAHENRCSVYAWAYSD